MADGYTIADQIAEIEAMFQVMEEYLPPVAVDSNTKERLRSFLRKLEEEFPDSTHRQPDAITIEFIAVLERDKILNRVRGSATYLHLMQSATNEIDGLSEIAQHRSLSNGEIERRKGAEFRLSAVRPVFEKSVAEIADRT